MKELTDEEFRARLREAGWKECEIDAELKAIHEDEESGAPPEAKPGSLKRAGWAYSSK